MDDLPGILFLLFAIYEPEEYDRLNKTKSITRDDIKDFIYHLYFFKVFGRFPEENHGL